RGPARPPPAPRAVAACAPRDDARTPRARARSVSSLATWAAPDLGGSRRPRGDELLGPLPVLLVVDVEPFVALGEERREHAALPGPRLGDDAQPRDLERAVLDVDRRQRLELAGVPGDVEVRLVEDGPHRP